MVGSTYKLFPGKHYSFSECFVSDSGGELRAGRPILVVDLTGFCGSWK